MFERLDQALPDWDVNREPIMLKLASFDDVRIDAL